MTARKSARKDAHKVEGPAVGQAEAINEVRLVGRLADAPRLRELPSGDTLWSLRVVVERPVPSAGARSRQRVDALECAVWSGRLKRQVARWSGGDIVEVSGALRRRFFRAGGAPASRVEVELTGGRIIRRAKNG